MAKIQIKSEKLTPFGGIFSIMEQFDALLAQTIDSTLGLRCTMFGYQYSEILRSLMCVYLCGGSCIEDVTTHLMKHLSLHPTLRTCSADTILRAIEELTFKSITYKSYWTFTQTTMLMPTCSRQTLVKDHAFWVKPAYYLKSLYGVRGFCVYDVSVMQGICTIKWIFVVLQAKSPETQ